MKLLNLEKSFVDFRHFFPSCILSLDYSALQPTTFNFSCWCFAKGILITFAILMQAKCKQT